MQREMIVGLLGAISIVASAGSALAQDVVIRYSNWLPATHWVMTDMINPYLAEIEKVTEGRVKVQVLPKVVGTPASQFEVVRDGLADMSWIVPGYTPGRYPLLEMGDLPFSAIDKPADARTFYEVYSQYFGPMNEFRGVKLMSAYNVGGQNPATRGVKIDKLADMKGLKLRVSSNTASLAVAALGAVPLVKSSTEAFELLSSGSIDGSMMLRETPYSSKSIDLLDHYTFVPGGVISSVQALIMNPEKWAEISPADQKAIENISGGAFAEMAGAANLAQDELGWKAMMAHNYTLVVADASFMGELHQSLDPLISAWVERAKAAGATDPEAVLTELANRKSGS